MHIYIYIYLPIEPKWPLFLKVNPSKQGLFQSKQGSFGFERYVYNIQLLIKPQDHTVERNNSFLYLISYWLVKDRILISCFLL